VYNIFDKYVPSGKWGICLPTPLFWTLIILIFGELAIFVILLFHSRLAPPWLERDFPKRFGYAAVAVFFTWALGIGLVSLYNSQYCQALFMTMRSGLAVGALFLLVGLMSFILLRV
jgi:energy-converting hydrogenase Eha subunit A